MSDITNNIARKSVPKIWDKAIGLGIFILTLTLAVPFLPDALSSVLMWVSLSLILMSVIVRLKLTMEVMRSPETQEAIRKAREEQRAERLKRKEFPAALYIFSVLVAALGLCFIFLVPQGFTSYQSQSKAASWPQTMGEVISSEVVARSRIRNPDEREQVQPKVVTQYSVNEKTYATREISFNQSRTWSTDYADASNLVNKYPPGAEATVYYNPELPSEAVLTIRYDWFTFFIMGLGALFVLLGIYWFWLSLRDTYLFFAGLLYKLKNRKGADR